MTSPGGSRPARPRRARPEPTPAQRALGLLVRREHSRKELVRKLSARGVEAADAVAAVERMATEGWQDDTRFAITLARNRAHGGHGPLWIRRELETHGLPPSAVEAAFAALAESGDDDWTATARALLARRLGEGPFTDPVRRRKAGELLVRRGFEGDVMRAAMRSDDDA